MSEPDQEVEQPEVEESGDERPEVTEGTVYLGDQSLADN